jgi:hypothetical protein
LLSLLVFLPNPPVGRFIIMALATLVGMVGALLIWASTKEEKRRPERP